MMRATLILAAVLTVAGTSKADAQHSIFRPVPRARMRTINTDRPGYGDNPYPMDAGRFQVEFGTADYMRGGAEPLSRIAWSALATTFRAGLLPTLEAAVSVAGYGRERLRAAGSANFAETRGVGDLALRLKLTLWGADSGATAAAVIPAVSFAGGTRQAGFLLSVPVTAALPRGWGVTVTGRAGVMPGVARRWVGTGSAALGLGHPVSKSVAAYVEGSADWSAEPGAVAAWRLGGGTTIALTPGIKIDFGGDLGLSSSADAVHVFSGLVVRF